MQFIKNTRVGAKLGIMIFIAFVALAAMAGLGYYELAKANDSLNAMYAERLVPIALLNDNRNQIRAASADLLELMLTTDVKKSGELKKEIDKRGEIAKNNFETIEKLPMDAKAKELMGKIWIADTPRDDNAHKRNYLRVEKILVECLSYSVEGDAWRKLKRLDPLNQCFTGSGAL